MVIKTAFSHSMNGVFYYLNGVFYYFSLKQTCLLSSAIQKTTETRERTAMLLYSEYTHKMHYANFLK